MLHSLLVYLVLLLLLLLLPKKLLYVPNGGGRSSHSRRQILHRCHIRFPRIILLTVLNGNRELLLLLLFRHGASQLLLLFRIVGTVRCLCRWNHPVRNRYDGNFRRNKATGKVDLLLVVRHRNLGTSSQVVRIGRNLRNADAVRRSRDCRRRFVRWSIRVWVGSGRRSWLLNAIRILIHSAGGCVCKQFSSSTCLFMP